MLYLSLSLVNSSLTAQIGIESDTTAVFEFNHVQWVNQFPLNQKQESKRSFFQRVGNIIFGKERKVLVTPISVVAESPDKYWVIDQYNGGLIFIEENKGDFLKYKTRDDEFFDSMTGICRIQEKGLMFSDSRSNKIFLLENGSNKLQVIGDSLDLQQPTGIAHSTFNQELWVIETKAHRISIIDTNGALLRIIGGRGIKPGEFNYPTHIWIDSKGYAYVVDAMNFRIQIFDNKGKFVSMFGEQGDGTGFIARPKGIATDSYGNIYVVDALFHYVQIFNSKGQLLYYFGGQGKDTGEFWMPNGIYIDKKDNIFVSDTYNSRIQIFNLTKVK